MMEKRWEVHPVVPEDAEAALGRYPPLMRQLLYNRGIKDEAAALRFLSAAAPHSADPMLLTDMENAVDRVQAALADGELIAVYGDYDADGVTATALLVQTLKALEANVVVHIPDRFEEGYGLNESALDDLKDLGAALVISVDCGIRAIGPAGHALRKGLDLIITDHHNPGETLPQAVAVINPKRPEDPYPDKNLAGVGTAYKLATAIVNRMNPAGFDPQSLLDLVALGTVADLVPLRGENRHLVRAGLERMRRPQRQGLFSLMNIAEVKPESVTAAAIGFRLGPRLNAAGRLDSALAAYELLTTDEVMRAGHLAMQLESQNRERQKITRVMQAAAEEKAVVNGDVPALLFAAHEDFNPGVVGLTASRLTEKYYRPAIVGQTGETHTRASCRSVEEFDITAALDQCADLLDHYGGHAAAAGFTVRNDRLPGLIHRLEAIAQGQLGHLDLRPLIRADAEVELEELNMDLLDQLELLQPTGNGNPEPVWIARELEVPSSRPVGRDQSHLKLKLSQGRASLDAIAFRLGHLYGNLPERVDAIFRFEKNAFRGNITPQMNIMDIRPS